MFRGILSGAFWGVIVSAISLALASLLGEQPAGNAPPDPPQVEAPGASMAPGAAPDAASGTDVAPVEIAGAPSIPEAPAPEVPSQDSAAPAADMTPATRPETGAVSSGLDSPQAAAPPEMSGPGDDPVLAPPLGRAPDSPGPEAAPDVSTQSAAPPPEVVPEAPDPAATDPSAADAPVAPSDTPGPDAPVVSDAPDSVVAPEAPEAPVVVEVVPAPEPPVVAEARDSVAVVEVTPEPDAPTMVEVLPEPDGAGDAPVVVEIVPDDPAPPPRFALSSETGSGLAGAPAAEAADDAVPALRRYGAEVETDGRPLIAVVMLDDGSVPEADIILGALPMKVTVVLDPAAEGAGARARAFRDAGFEVGILARLPAGATPQDVEVNMAAALRAVPDAVVLVDAGEGGLQANRAATDQAIAALAERGMGFVSISQGLNTALRSAEAAGVPATTIYRDLDAEGQDARVVRRFLEQAAFRARQDAGTTVLARLRPDTISALILWGTAARDGQVQPGPVSTLLLEQSEEG
ncbi:divergent polysaccharide deacetylase family protein [Roseisalinus antarcticus]|uniref:Divergent polysaccharide deacetylase n=1 Tax=Roseisalinus antarcticus TaxID=254357 RepID=A0A1Y5RJC7_9RHOB|nr:divergent polysaccharide deacetylase family protein [Roseisalinus antarcticus]SLN16219.1 Divergent polysaccharide deacetylase [Roseisalinus antarcticus]